MDEKQAEHTEKKSFLSRLIRILLLVVFWFSSSIAFIFLLFLFLFQFSFFREYSIPKILSAVNSQLIAKLELDDISLSAFPRIELSGVRLITEGDTLLNCSRLYADVSIWALLNNNIKINQVFIQSPQIKLLRNSNTGVWNYERIAEPTAKKEPAKIETMLNLKELIIDNASITYIDSLSLKNKNYKIIGGRINPEIMKISDFSLRLSSKFNLKKLTGELDLQDMQFIENISGFQVKNFDFNMAINPNSIEIKKFLFNSAISKIDFSAKVDGIALSEPINDTIIKKLNLDLKINKSYVHTSDIRKLIGMQDLPDESINFEMAAVGNLNKVNLKYLKAGYNNTELNLNAVINQPLDSNLQYITANLDNTKIQYNDIAKFIPVQFKSKIPAFGYINLDKLYLSGNRKKIQTVADIKTAFGKLEGKADVDLTDEIKYNLDMKFNGIDLNYILKNPNLKGIFTGSVTTSGRGIDLKTLSNSLDLRLENSSYGDYTINNLNLNCNLEKGLLNLDTFNLVMPRNFTSEFIQKFYLENPTIAAAGSIDISNMNCPKYNLWLDLKAINIAKLLGNKQAPEYFSTTLKVEGENFNPDSIRASIKSSFNDIVFGDRAIVPFDMSIDINTQTPGSKSLQINSEIIKLSLTGNFSVSALARFGEIQGGFWSMIVYNKLNQVMDTSYAKFNYNKPFLPADFQLNAEVKDLTPANTFLYHEKLFTKIKLDISGNITEKSAIISLNKLDIQNFRFVSDYFNMDANAIDLKGKVNIQANDTNYYLKTAALIINSNSLTKINDLDFYNPSINFVLNDSTFNYEGSVNINKDLLITNTGEVKFADKALYYNSKDLKVLYKNLLNLKNEGSQKVSIVNNFLVVNNLSFRTLKNELLRISGDYTSSGFKDFKLKLMNYDLANIDSIMVLMQKPPISMIKGKIKEFEIVANGSLENPALNLNLKTDNITINSQKTGIVNAAFNYNSRRIYGKADISDSITNKHLLDINIESFPIDLSFGSEVKSRIHSDYPIKIKASADNLPLHIASPFVTPISNLSGAMSMNLDIYGDKLESVTYSGDFNIPNAAFTLNANNLDYKGMMSAVFDNKHITIKQASLFNSETDLKNGRADLNGEIEMEGFQLTGYNLTASSSGIRVLSKTSSKAMPTIYGDFDVSTGANKLSIIGDLNHVNISGDINILKGNLFMPQFSNQQASSSLMTYKVLAKTENNKVYYKIIDPSSGKELFSEGLQIKDSAKPALENTKKSTLANNIFMNLNFRFMNKIIVKMDLGPLGMLVANLGTEKKDIPLILDYDSKKDINLTGEITLFDGSTLSYVKKFDTQGKVSFPFGSISNPQLDLKAIYNGKSYYNDRLREFKVYLYLTGTKSKPNLRFEYEIDGETAVGDSSQISQDAIMLVLVGRTKSEMGTTGAGASTADIGNLGMSGVSAALTKTISDLLSSSGAVQSAEIDMQNGNWDQARVKFSGQFFNNIGWKLGGDLNDITNNSEVSIDIPLGFVLHPQYLNNIVWQISRSTNNQQATINRNQKEWEVKLKFGGSW